MYTFVFLWTPALSPKGERLPHGMIFACFMGASMAGTLALYDSSRNTGTVLGWLANIIACESREGPSICTTENDLKSTIFLGLPAESSFASCMEAILMSSCTESVRAALPGSRSTAELGVSRVGAGGPITRPAEAQRGTLHAGRFCSSFGGALRASSFPHNKCC